MKWFRFGLVAISAGLLAGACGGSSEGNKGSGPVAEEELTGLIVDSICSIRECCEAAGESYDEAGCRARYEAQLAGMFEGGPNTQYDPVAAGRCLDAVRAAVATCGEQLPSGDDCSGVTKGVLGPGEACTSSNECSAPPRGSAYCDEVCIQIPRARLGESCDTTCEEQPGFVSCSGGGGGSPGECFRNDGLYCAPDGRCAELSQLGEPCLADSSCRGDGHCDFQAGLCVANSGIGSPCAYSDECKAGLYCSPTGQCAETLAPGAPCDQHAACGDRAVCDGGVCAGVAFPSAADCSGNDGQN